MITSAIHAPPTGRGEGAAGAPAQADWPPPGVPTAPKPHFKPRRSRRRLLRKNLRNSLGDAATFSVMVGIGETYFPAFVLALGLGEIASGLISSVPILVGAMLQLVSPWAVARLGSNRRWVIACVIVQSASFLPLVATALVGSAPAALVFAAVSFYWAGGLGAGPAWNTWMETVVPFRVRAPFFATRTRMGQAGVLLGFLAGGFLLQQGKQTTQLLGAFALIFSVASACRFLSARFLSRQSEHALTGKQQKRVGLGEIGRRILQGRSERLLVYFLAVQVAVQISGPYFSPFMLRQLKISYLDYVALLAASFVAKIVTLPACGRIAGHWGARRLLWAGGIGIMPVAGLWLYAHSFWQLVAVQFVAGAVWAAYELAMLLMFFETVEREERTSILTVFNLANSVALVLGALLGGGLLKFLGASREAYLVLFALSSFARAATLLVLRLAPRESSLSAAADEANSPASPPAAVAEVVP